MMALGLLTLVGVLASVFYVSTVRYQYHLQRSELAHAVLVRLLSVSDHTYRKLNAMGEIVAQRRIDDPEERIANEKSLRKSMANARQSIALEVAFVPEENENERSELEQLTQIERLVENIIRVSERIRINVEAGNVEVASADLGRLRSNAVAGEFSRLINLAIAEEWQEVETMKSAAQRLSVVVKTVLPLTLLVALVFGLSMVFIVSRGLSRSVDALRNAASAYSSGQFNHRMPVLHELEFVELRKAMHHMADELRSRRAAAEEDRSTLEALVSERTRELAQSNERLEHVDLQRRQFLSDISHELRTPLTVIQGESEMGLRGMKQPDEYRDALNRVFEQAVHINRLVDDLLFVARAEEGHARLEKQAISIDKLLNSVVSDFRGIAGQNGVSIIENYLSAPISVLGDKGRLRQVVAILLDNAMRYSSASGTIQVGARATAGRVEITVEDDGIGITEEEAKQVFLRFYRGSNAKRHASGTGLGLPVAKAIVDAHGGTISLTGKPGEGATARVTLPSKGGQRAVV